MTDGSGKKGVTLSNADLAFARLGNSTVASLDTRTPQINMLAGGQVDGRSLGIQDQNGASHFVQRFALHPHGDYDPAAAMKFALEHQNPFITGAVIGENITPYPADTYSLLTVANPNVLLWALKPAEEGIAGGVIVRLWNLSDKPAKSDLSFQPGIAAATRTTHIETDIQAALVSPKGAMTATFARQQLQTYRVRLRGAPAAE